jgi:hypothetical protein
MSAWRRQPARKRLETSLWTGPFGHLLGGGLDLTAALCKHGFARARRARRRGPRAARRAPAERSSSLRR